MLTSQRLKSAKTCGVWDGRSGSAARESLHYRPQTGVLFPGLPRTPKHGGGILPKPKLARANFRVIKLESFLGDRKQFAFEIQFYNGSMLKWPKVRCILLSYPGKVLLYDLTIYLVSA